MRLSGALRVRLRLLDISGQHWYLNAANGYCRQSSGNTHACGDGIGHYGGHASIALELGCIRESTAVAVMPGIRSLMVRETTPVSPKEGST